MSFGEEKHPWSVFDGVKSISIGPEPLMAEINAAIAALEYARASAFPQSPPLVSKTKNANKRMNSQYDANIASQAYKAGLTFVSSGKVDEAIVSLNLALSKCPPDQTSAIAKLQSLLSLTSKQHQKLSN